MDQTCAFCDGSPYAVVKYKITVLDPESGKEYYTDVELLTCTRHANLMTVQIEKTINLDPKAWLPF